MRLWLLRPIEDLPKDDNPWEPWYDKCFGMVVRADTEDEARATANANAGDEQRGEFLGRQTSEPGSAWSSRYSTCVPLTEAGEPGVVIKDVWSA